MKAEKFTGTAIEQLDLSFRHLVSHKEHFLLYSLVDLHNGAIRCSTCKLDVISGNREFVEFLWLEWSMLGSEE
jgi:hypothetical protein